jgi:GNAT superfamily N-acetyltransferase
MEANTPVKMLRSNLDKLPDFPLPPGFSFRWFRAGDEPEWVRIQTLSDQLNAISLKLFHSELSVSDLLPTTQFYLLAPNTAAIGTATAWSKELDGKRIGRVHWVAVVPEFQGRGLGKAVLSFCCRRLRELGYDQAFLSTSSARIPAINLYLNFGFEPLIATDEERLVWNDVLARASRGAPSSRLPSEPSRT